jgi:hypothetical protein
LAGRLAVFICGQSFDQVEFEGVIQVTNHSCSLHFVCHCQLFQDSQAIELGVELKLMNDQSCIVEFVG